MLVRLTVCIDMYACLIVPVGFVCMHVLMFAHMLDVALPKVRTAHLLDVQSDMKT